MNCPHCEHHRAQLAARGRCEVSLPLELHATVRTCPCDCHTPARIAGALPKVGTA